MKWSIRMSCFFLRKILNRMHLVWWFRYMKECM